MQTRLLLALALVWALTCPVSAFAQVNARGWSLSHRFLATSNSPATAMKADTRLALSLDPQFEVYAGLPLYFVRQASYVAPAGDRQFLNGVGNLYVGFRVPVQGEAVDYTADVMVAAPTGERDRGLNTGRVTIDWNNSFSRSFGAVTPFGNIGLANSVSDSYYFVRPFTSLGLVSHFEGGAVFKAVPAVSVTGLAYAVRASGEQRIFSRIVDRPFVRGPGPGLGQSRRVFEVTPNARVSESFVHDHGIAAGLDLNPESQVSFQVGYSRSMRYDLDSLYFGVGFRVGPLNR